MKITLQSLSLNRNNEIGDILQYYDQNQINYVHLNFESRGNRVRSKSWPCTFFKYKKLMEICYFCRRRWSKDSLMQLLAKYDKYGFSAYNCDKYYFLFQMLFKAQCRLSPSTKVAYFRSFLYVNYPVLLILKKWQIFLFRRKSVKFLLMDLIPSFHH